MKKYQVISVRLDTLTMSALRIPSRLFTVDAVDVRDALGATQQHHNREMSDDVYVAVAVICDGKLVWDGRQ